MQIEIYNMIPADDKLSITLEAVCDSFSSLLWDIEYYACGVFEVYIAASPKNIEIFRTGRIVGRDDDKEHYGLIESVQLETDAEDGDLSHCERSLFNVSAGEKNHLSHFQLYKESFIRTDRE